MGVDYYIAVHGPDGFVNSTGVFQLDISCNPACTPQVNQDCMGAITVAPALVGTGTPVMGDNTCGFADANPSCDVDLSFVPSAPGAVGVWYTFNSGINTAMFLTVDDNNSNPALTATASSYALYTGTCGALVEVSCARNIGGTGQLTLAVDAGLDYYLMIYNEGGVGVEGTFEFLLEEPAQLDAEVTSITEPMGTICTTTIEPLIVLTNNGLQTLTSVDITYDIDGGTPVVFNWTGSLGFGSSFNITLPPSVTTTGGHTLNVSVSNPNGGVDEVMANDMASGMFTVGGEAMDLNIFTDGFGNETTWEVFDPFFLLAASGGPYPNNAMVVENLCLSTLFGNCFSFFIYDSFGDGMCCANGNGFWEIQAPTGDVLLRDIFHGSGTAAGSFISDGNQSPSATPNPGTPAYALGHEFCLPQGPSVPTTRCGVLNNTLNNKVIASFVPGASNYQFRFSNPDDAFGRNIATGSREVLFSQLVPNAPFALAPGITYFVQVRADEGATGFFDDSFGAGCEMALDAANVPGCAQLIDNLGGSTHSCGVSRSLDVGDKIWATPILGASEYQFRFENVAEGYLRFVRIPNYVLTLTTYTVLPLEIGFTYDVTVQAFIGGAPGGFCGAVCQLTIVPPPAALTSGARGALQASGGLAMYPNPVRDGLVQLTLSDLVDEEQNITVEIYDLFGKLVVSQEFGNAGTGFNTLLELDKDIAAGTYQVTVTANDQLFTETLIIQ